MNEKTVVLFVAAIPAFLTPFMGSAISIALPPIGMEFGSDTILLGWIVTAYFLAAGIFSVPSGRLADIIGVKKVFTVGIFVYTIGSVLSAIAPSAEFLIGSRVIQGIGVAMDYATRLAILTSAFPPVERGKVLGINIGVTYTGLSLGPLLGGLLTHNFGWRSIFIINIAVGILAFILASGFLRSEYAGARGEKFDLIGSLLYGISLLCIIYGLSESVWRYLTFGILALVLFAIYECRIEHPVFEVRQLITNHTFSFSNIAALLNYSATFGVVFVLSLYLQYIKGLTPQQAGLILVAQPVIMAIIAPFAGWLSDKIEPRGVASAGMAITTLSLFIFAGIDADTTMGSIVANLILLGFGLGLFASPNTNAIMGSVSRRFFGSASATVATMRLLGQLLSMALVMLVLSIEMGRVAITPEYYPMFITSARTAFRIFTVLCFIGVFASLGRGRTRV